MEGWEGADARGRQRAAAADGRDGTGRGERGRTAGQGGAAAGKRRCGRRGTGWQWAGRGRPAAAVVWRRAAASRSRSGGSRRLGGREIQTSAASRGGPPLPPTSRVAASGSTLGPLPVEGPGARRAVAATNRRRTDTHCPADLTRGCMLTRRPPAHYTSTARPSPSSPSCSHRPSPSSPSCSHRPPPPHPLSRVLPFRSLWPCT